MMVIPAIDLREGRCVQLVGGSYDMERIRLEQPVEVARGWANMGFGRLHVVDLDAATGRGSNADVVDRIAQDVDASIQVGGGIRTAERIEQLLSGGVERVVLGTRAVEEPIWLEEMAAAFPGQIVVAVDAHGRRVLSRGWSRVLSRDVLSVIEDLNDLPIAAVMVTAVQREGRQSGTDLFLMADAGACSAHPVIASGGIASINELRELADREVSAAIVGMALYTGALDMRGVIEEFAE